MDIFQYVNSKDIREHLKKVNYEFNSLEAIWLVYQNYKITFDEKCKAWYEIMENMEDMQFDKKSLPEKFPSIFNAVKEYIELKKEQIKIFFDNSDGSIYKFTIKACLATSGFREFEILFSSVNDVIKYIKNNREDMNFLERNKLNGPELPFEEIVIRKIIIGADERDYNELFFNQNFEIMDVSICNDLFNKHNEHIQNILYCFFDRMWFDFPVPFVKGDIVYNPRNNDIGEFDSGPFVLENIVTAYMQNDNREGHDNSDMTAYGYFLWKNGDVYWECMHRYMDLEYYDKEITGVVRALIPLSNCMKEKIGIDLCVRGYHQILLEEAVKQETADLGLINDEGIELMGIECKAKR